MQVGLIGIGRMGRELAKRLKDKVELVIFDRDSALLRVVGSELAVRTAGSIEELADLGTVVLAVPDQEVINCIKDYNQLKVPLVIINIATNVARHVLEETAARHVRCIGVKFVGHAGEMMLGMNPVIIIDSEPADLIGTAQQVFSQVGQVFIGNADLVSYINNMAAEKALEAAVSIEDGLRQQGVAEPQIIKSAIRQVAAGIMKAYADDNMGPFARQVIRAVRAKHKV